MVGSNDDVPPRRLLSARSMATANPFDLSGRQALVTGGGGGLGFAIARGLAAAGAHVVLNGRNRAKLDAAVSMLGAEGATASAAPFDVSQPDAVAAGIA